MQVMVPATGFSSFNYSFSYLCLLDERNICIIDDIIRTMEEIQSARSTNSSMPIVQYPITQLADGRRAYIGHQLGGVQGWGPGGAVKGPGGGAKGEGVRSARALQLTYYLQAPGGGLMDRVASQWEKAFCAELKRFGAEHPELGLFPFTSSSLRTDFQFTSVLARRPLLASLGVCSVLAVMCCSMRDCVRSKPWLGLLALLSITLSGLTAAGILNLTGATYNSTYLGIPFIMLGRLSHCLHPAVSTLAVGCGRPCPAMYRHAHVKWVPENTDQCIHNMICIFGYLLQSDGFYSILSYVIQF